MERVGIIKPLRCGRLASVSVGVFCDCFHFYILVWVDVAPRVGTPKARTSLCRLGGNGGLLSNVPVFSDDHPALVVVAPPCYMHSNSVAVHIAAELDKSPARRFLFGVKEIVCGCVILICHICVSYLV